MPAWIIGKPVTNKTKAVLGIVVLKKLFYKKYF